MYYRSSTTDHRRTVRNTVGLKLNAKPAHSVLWYAAPVSVLERIASARAHVVLLVGSS